MSKQRLWVRIDNRLVHGQVVETWLPYSNARTLLVANDQLAEDELRQELLRLAVPTGVRILFSQVLDAADQVADLEPAKGTADIFLLFSTCGDAKRAYLSGLKFTFLNVGNIHFSQGKRQVCDHIALDQEDIYCLRYLQEQGVHLDFRCLPNTQVNMKALW
ncbi:PTS sugar transporter subunit IIB [Desulfovermiculus halophilus]|uniref:PTS sugar transporter subunit IIB n=1 Tax=Desulfovermiculus halophilus TaxID=339722 RepID=UPI000483C367|nr:PTS sugar transporter subunit IIB [Desulfovermiculus halophilus]